MQGDTGCCRAQQSLAFSRCSINVLNKCCQSTSETELGAEPGLPALGSAPGAAPPGAQLLLPTNLSTPGLKPASHGTLRFLPSWISLSPRPEEAAPAVTLRLYPDPSAPSRSAGKQAGHRLVQNEEEGLLICHRWTQLPPTLARATWDPRGEGW